MSHIFLKGVVPSIVELEKNISFRLVNDHHSMTYARPKMPGLTYVAGIHIKPLKSLPTDVQVPIHFANAYLITYSFGI